MQHCQVNCPSATIFQCNWKKKLQNLLGWYKEQIPRKRKRKEEELVTTHNKEELTGGKNFATAIGKA